MGYPKLHLLYYGGRPLSLYVVTSGTTYEHWMWGWQKPETEQDSGGFNPMLEKPIFGLGYMNVNSQSSVPYRHVYEEDVDHQRIDELINQMKNQQQLEHDLF